MNRRQTRIPRQWLITDERLGPNLDRALRALPSGSGVVVRDARLRRRVRRLVAGRHIAVTLEGRGVARVHDTREIRDAQLRGARLLLLSPLFPTRSHPDRRPLPRMRVAALLRLTRVPVIALGGMNRRRFRRVQALGFVGWAGIDAWLKVTNVTR
ncbi:MAG TPA: thiamine phosphate synthase [Sphingomicrobium sp.]|nr:thiamine phosphate synthase [Sphingomicrobium sp.]